MMTAANYSVETQEMIQELIECSFAEDDMYDFINEHGESEFRSWYPDYVDLGESYGYECVDAFIKEFGFDFDNFKDAYYGEFSWDDFVEQYVDENVMYQIPEQYQAYFDYDAFSRDLSYDFIEVNGYIFNRNV